MSFEDSILRKIDRERPKKREAPPPSPIETAHARAKTVLTSKDYAIQAPEFIPLYGKENVFADMQRVKDLRDKFNAEFSRPTKAAEVFEALVLEQSELNEWLGKNVTVLKTSVFDDYFNGVDMVAEWQEAERESQVLALAVDVTSGTGGIAKKLSRIRDEVDRGELGSIKYFKTADGTFKGQRSFVPKVVVGASFESIENVARLWNEKKNKELADHPIQRTVLNEIEFQLKTIRRYAENKGLQRVAEAYSRDLAIIEKVMSEKETKGSGLVDDPVYQELMTRTRTIFRA